MTLLAQQENQFGQFIGIVIIFVVVIFLLVGLAVFTRYFRLWIQSKTTGAV